MKCDEKRPICFRCAQGKIRCDWDQPVPRSRATPPRIRKPTAIYTSPVTLASAASKPQDDDPGLLAGAADNLQVQVEHHSSSPDLDQNLEIYRGPAQGVVRPALSTSHIPLANSIVLSSQDLQSFNYVPGSLMVLRFGKPWQWSMLSYVHSRIACREAGVMRAFIAVASMELRFLELLKFQDATPTVESLARTRELKESATDNLHLALQDLSLILDRLSGGQSQPEDIEALFSIWFLILHVGLYDPEFVSASHVHLKGIRSFLQRYIDGDVAREQDYLPPVSQQLLLFIA